jgi:hypothetical protein
MGVEYDRIQRPSIYQIATIGDIPFEVIQKALRLVGRPDLISASLSCRAWRQATAELIIATKRFDDQRDMDSFVCGMQLKSIVSGFEQYSIKNLYLNMHRNRIEHVRVMAQIVAPTLSGLGLDFECPQEEESDLDCYEVVEAFFSSCLQIRCLRLEFFDFGGDPTSFTPTIEGGFGRLKSLKVINCRGDLMMFAELAPIQNLSKIDFVRYANDASVASAIISAIFMKCRLLKMINIFKHFESWESIHKIVEYCRELEEVTLYDLSRNQLLKNPEIVAIASLPRLKSLDLSHCLVDGGALSRLARCKGLRHLRGVNMSFSSDLIRAVGGNLISLQCKLGSGILEGVIEFCPNLVNLDIMVVDERGNWVNEDAILTAEGLIKRQLKKLSKLVINRRMMRLGADLEG